MNTTGLNTVEKLFKFFYANNFTLRDVNERSDPEMYSLKLKLFNEFYKEEYGEDLGEYVESWYRCWREASQNHKKKIYDYCVKIRGNELHPDLYSRWERLSLERAQKAQEIKSLKGLVKFSPPDSEAKNVAKKKWANLTISDLKSAETFEAASRMYNDAMPKSNEKIVAFKKMISLVTNMDNILKLFATSVRLGDRSAKLAVYMKWELLSLEMYNLYKNNPDHVLEGWYPPKESLVMYEFNKKRDAELLLEIKSVSLFDDAIDLYRECSNESTVKIVAFKKLVKLAKTDVDCMRAYKMAPCNSAERAIARKKWDNLSLKIISNYNPSQAEVAYKSAIPGTKTKALLLHISMS